MNKIILMGRLTRDPEIFISTTSSTTVAKYTLAVDRRFKKEKQPEADFFNCAAFGKSAEFAEKYLKKGMKICITGRIESDNYTNKNGEKVYGFAVIIDEQEFAESKKDSGVQNETPGFEDFSNVPDDELPFN